MKIPAALALFLVCFVHLPASEANRKMRRKVSELEKQIQAQSSFLQTLQDLVNELPTFQDIQTLQQTVQDQGSAIQALQDQVNDLEGCCSQDTVFQEIYTPNGYNYQVVGDDRVTIPGGETYVKFEVKACNDAHVLLMQGTSTTQSIYELVIGGWGNSQSVIRNQQQGTHLATTRHEPLNCYEFHPFWVSWDAGVIRVGSGLTVGEDEFISYTGPAFQVNHVAVSTGWGATGEWRMYNNF